MDNSKKRRILGIPNRYIVLACIVFGALAAYGLYYPALPHIQLPAEAYPGDPLFTLPVIGEFYWTNTLTATVLADIILIIIALVVRRAVKSGELVPKGFSGAIEAILEGVHNLTESTAGKWTKTIFPFFATITLLVLVVNWMELIPGVDSIGFIVPAEHEGYPIEEVLPGVVTVLSDRDAAKRIDAGEHLEGYVAEGDHAEGAGYGLLPFVRVASTDLNFTVALALISVVMTQVFGFRSLGLSYAVKFVNVKGIISNPGFGIIDFFVGLLELISEISKILSFSFRLFGNIFAGSVLLFVIGTLVPVLAQSAFLMLEFFVGIIQAVVFGMLTMVFMSQAVTGHGDHEEEHAH